MHGFDSGDDDLSARRGLESEHPSCNLLDGPVVLFDDIVQVFVLAHQDINAGVGLDSFNCGRVGAALLESNLLWHVVPVDGTLQKPPCRGQIAFGGEQKVNGIACAGSTAR